MQKGYAPCLQGIPGSSSLSCSLCRRWPLPRLHACEKYSENITGVSFINKQALTMELTNPCATQARVNIRHTFSHRHK